MLKCLKDPGFGEINSLKSSGGRICCPNHLLSVASGEVFSARNLESCDQVTASG